MYVVAGASGNTGRAAAEKLLAEGKKVRVLGRNAERLQTLVDKGAEAFEVDLLDTTKLAEALKGADAAYLLIPPDPTVSDMMDYMARVTGSLVEAVKKSGVGNVVFLSSIGAHHAEGTGPIKGLHRAERKFKALGGVNVLFLRATYFMENLYMSLQPLKQFGVMSFAVAPHVKMSMIATRDIGTYAAERMMKGDISGHKVQELLGQRDLTMVETTRALGTEIGKPNLPYQQIDEATLRQALTGMGASESVAEEYLEMNRGFNNGLVAPEKPRSAESTTQTSIEEFAKQFGAAFRSI